MNILVTGATGYLGSYLIKLLVKDLNNKITAIVREGTNIDKLNYPNIKVLKCDLNNKNKLSELLKDSNELDVVFHLAAGLSGSHYELMINSVVATSNLVFALKHCIIRRFVLVSSFSVYKGTAVNKNGILNENVPVEDNIYKRDSYTATKVQQESFVQKYCNNKKIPLVIIRPGKIYGPRTDLLPPQLGIKIPGLCFLMVGGNHYLPLTHVQNCADAIYLSGVKETIKKDIFINIVDDKLPTQKDFYHIYKKNFGRIKNLITIPDIAFKLFAFFIEFLATLSKENFPPAITIYRYENMWKPLKYNNQLAKDILGWKPQISIVDGLNETFKIEKMN